MEEMVSPSGSQEMAHFFAQVRLLCDKVYGRYCRSPSSRPDESGRSEVPKLVIQFALGFTKTSVSDVRDKS